MTINGLPLPSLLCHLVESRAWKRPDDDASFRELTKTGNPEDFTFLDFDGMARETGAARQLAADLTTARLYGLKPLGGSEAPGNHEELLDVAKAVMIAVSWDEDAVFLDYRSSSEPSVVLSSWSDDAGNVTSRKLASNFDEFARCVGLLSEQTRNLK